MISMKEGRMNRIGTTAEFAAIYAFYCLSKGLDLRVLQLDRQRRR